MNALVQTLPSSSMPAAQEGMQPPVDVSRAQRMYAAWEAIFENARPSDAAQSLSSRREQPHWHPGPLSALMVHEWRDDSVGVELVAEERAPVSTEKMPMIPPDAGDELAHSATSNAGGAQSSGVGRVCTTAHVLVSGAAESVDDVTARARYIHPSLLVAGPRPDPEAISIVLQGTNVSIVVRDAQLSEADALQSALDTARELTGTTAGLRQLMLNGRVLYRQPGPSFGTGNALFDC